MTAVTVIQGNPAFFSEQGLSDKMEISFRLRGRDRSRPLTRNRRAVSIFFISAAQEKESTLMLPVYLSLQNQLLLRFCEIGEKRR
jgi:hypothetical protein